MRKPSKRAGWLGVAALSLTLILAGCGSAATGPSSTGNSAGGTIKIGAPDARTGSLANEGKLVHDGYTLWQNLINKQGGLKVNGKKYKVEVVFKDDQSNPTNSASLTEQMYTQDGIRLFLSPYASPNIFSATTVAERHKVPMIAAGGGAKSIFTRGYKYVFSSYPYSGEYLGSVLDLLATKGIKTVAFLHADDLFSQEADQGGEAYAKSHGFDVVYSAQYPSNATDLTSQLAQIAQKKPDALIGTGHFQEAVLLVKEAKQMNVNFKAIAFTVGPSMPSFAKTLGKDSEGILGASLWTPDLPYKDSVFGTAANYAKLYKEAFGVEPDYHSAMASAAAEMMGLAIEKAGSTNPQKVRDALANLGTVSLFDGTFTVEANGSISGLKLPVIQVQNGQTVTVWPGDFSKNLKDMPLPAWNKRQ
ncbi:leucine-, isoleucine-, valine-, threonine-, and alanine-binding protein precursor [Peptococcaceae bacterium CEB3]|nr:leucine-, isoleucine-, valine-, threonine-, and alanine-binding protein precursor [Peptococcaceae bacterium CEB3]